jgi:hypothetical protein
MLPHETALSRELRFDVVPPESLEGSERESMYALMRANYDGMDPARFSADLAAKDLVILVREPEGALRGFSTVAFNPGSLGSRGYDVIFSGDTIISPEHWGSPALSQGFRSVMGGFKGVTGGRDLFWFLISKGHRTYLYLPLYFRRYHPALETDRSEDLSEVADACAQALFPGAWNRNTGLIRFSDPLDHLKPELADVGPGKSDNPHVRFFLERNPGYLRGDELACVARVEKANLLRPDPRFFGAAQESPPALFRAIAEGKSGKAA